MFLILAATPVETALLRQHLVNIKTLSCADRELLQGELCGAGILLAHGGVGSMLMTMQLTRFLSSYRPEAILLCGCGGSYPDSELAVGDLALAKAETYGDCGATTDTGFIPLEELKISQEPRYAPIFQQSYNLDTPLLQNAVRLLPEAGCGTFVTVNNCSNSYQLSRQLQQQTGGICENMEGAAVAQVCAEFSIPLLELRGISNPTGTRANQLWDIPRGVRVAQEGVLTLLQRGLRPTME